MRILLAFLACVVLGGCGMTPAEVHEASTADLAFEYGARGSTAAEQELRSRGAFTDEQWDRIKARDVRVGDDIALVYASLGWPRKGSGSVKVADGTRRWLRYDTGYPGYAPIVVYTRNDRVIAIEE